MPLYEFVCDGCRRRFTVLVGMTASPDAAGCPHCGCDRATRVMSRFVRARADDDIDEDNIPDPDDPAAMRQWAKEMGDELGEDLGPEFDEYIDSAEADEE